MAWWKRKKQASTAAPPKGAAESATVGHLTDFIRSRRGVEAFVEAPTTVSQASILLVAHDGEWTRRRIPSVEWGHRFAEHESVPAYDAGVVRYPDRMREWNRRQKLAEDQRGPGKVAD